jgi:hypothetical protein
MLRSGPHGGIIIFSFFQELLLWHLYIPNYLPVLVPPVALPPRLPLLLAVVPLLLYTPKSPVAVLPRLPLVPLLQQALAL